jgi:hypothetical protein
MGAGKREPWKTLSNPNPIFHHSCLRTMLYQLAWSSFYLVYEGTEACETP